MSITQVAEQAGVSISTVSRYLRGSLNVNPDTAQRINEAAQAFGYTPRAEVNDVNAVALVIPALQNPFYSALAQSIVEAGIAANYYVDIKISQGDPQREIAIVDDVARQRRYHGLLYAGLNSTNPSLARIQPAGMRLVLIDEQIDDPKLGTVASVTVDNYSGAYQAVSYLLSLGHRHIAYLSGPTDLSTARDRFRGYTAALRSADIDVDESIVFRGPYTEEFGSSIFPYLLDKTERPTAIFCGSDIAAVGLLGASERYGIRIPDDLSVIGCDGIHIGQWLSPSLTTLQQPMEAIARAAVSMLAPEAKARHVQLPLSLVTRGSTQRLA